MKAAPWVREFLSFLLPARCLGCGQARPAGEEIELVCPTCRTRLREPGHPRCSRCSFPLGTGQSHRGACLSCDDWPDILMAAHAAVVLAPPADALVHGLKYGGWPELAPVLARRMAALPLPEVPPGTATVTVPVPTSARRMRERGYNQAERLARAFAGERGFSLVEVLERRESDRTQVSLHPLERRDNVEDAFRLLDLHRDRIRGAHVLLVDDVLTTGATVCAAARALERGSVRGVSVVAFARAVPTLGGGRGGGG